MIVKKSDGYHLMSKDGERHLGGPYATKAKALAREFQVRYWKKKAS